MTAKKTRKTQVPTARLVITICAIALTVGAFHLAQTGLTILSTQWKMYSYYTNIQDANNQHDYFYNRALMYPHSGYMKEAEEWDDIARELTDERSAFVASATDPVVKWACRDQFEALTVLAGAIEFVVGLILSLLGLGYIILTFVSMYMVKKHRHRAARRAEANSHRVRKNQSVAPYHTR